METFNSSFTSDFLVFSGGILWVNDLGELTGPTSIRTYDKWDVTAGTFDAGMVSMELSGQINGISLLIRQSPTLPSFGSTSITDVGGGLYNIGSFFDVFTELSVDGGEIWIPSTDLMRMDLEVPEPATIALLVLGAFVMSRKPEEQFTR